MIVVKYDVWLLVLSVPSLFKVSARLCVFLSVGMFLSVSVYTGQSDHIKDGKVRGIVACVHIYLFIYFLHIYYKK